MSQIPSAASVQARRAREQYESCPVCQSRLVSGDHVDRCEENQAYLDRSRHAGGAAGVPQVTTDDLHAHLITRCHNALIAALVVELVIDLGWRPVVGNDPARLWKPDEVGLDDECPAGGDHDWTSRPESDTWVCDFCGAER